MRNIEGNEDPHDDVMVDFVEGFGPVSHEVDYCSRLVGVVGVLDNEIDDGEKCMGTGSSWNSVLARIIVFGDVMEESSYTRSSFQNKSFKCFVEKFCERDS